MAWKSIPDFIQSPFDDKKKLFISVIVPVRNEAENILNLINAIKKQNYSSSLFELIIVDDHSTDNTVEIIRPFVNEKIRLVSLQMQENIVAYKKMAIDAGIKNSRGELIVTTDADCTMTEDWLSTIAGYYEQHHPKMIVMPVAIKNNGTVLGLFQLLDFMSLQGITGAAVNKKIHGMCNGANLAYTRKVFDEVNGFKDIDHIPSGDDMLLMQKVAMKYKEDIHYLKSKSVIVTTNPEKTISSFFNQRIRWASKADKYQDKTLFPVLFLVYFVNLFFVLMFIYSLLYNFTFYILNFIFDIPKSLLIFLLLKTTVELFFLYPVSRFFGNIKVLWFFPLFQPFHIVYTVIAGFFGKFGSYEWKGRRPLPPTPLQ